jgi:hypothetical protein
MKKAAPATSVPSVSARPAAARAPKEPAQRQDEEGFRKIIAHLPEPVRELALGARGLILKVLPRAHEVVWERQKTAGYGTGPKKMSEHFCWLLFGEQHVALGFYYGTELPDPAGLLTGTGKLMRHVKIKSGADLQDPALLALVRAATTHRVPPLRD